MALLTIEVIHRFVMPDVVTPAILTALQRLEQTMAMNQEQLTAALTQINASLTEAGNEITTEINALREALAAAGNLTPENEAHVNNIVAKAQALADVVPNQAPDEPLG